MGRTTIAVNDEVAAKLSEESKKRNITEYSLANQLLETELRLLNSSMDAEDVESSAILSQFVKSMDGLPLPVEIIGELTEYIYKKDKKWLEDVWYNLGKKLGAYVRTYVFDVKELESQAKHIIKFVPIKLVKVDTENEKSLKISLIGAWSFTSLSFCIAQVLKGIVETYGYKLKNLEYGKGFVTVKASI